jgi:hypothetical protein
MTTLHIEHPITDLGAWLAAFDRFADARTKAGVQAQRVQHPVDNPNYILIDLDFATTEEAGRFLAFLNEKVWSSTDNAPALVGTPQTRLLQYVGVGRRQDAGHGSIGQQLDADGSHPPIL